MRKALICLLFAVVAIAQPTGIGVDLSVVSVDSGSGEVCFKADAWPDGAIFDGTNDHIVIPDHAELDFGADADFTIETWFKMDAGSRQNPLVAKIVGAYPDFTGYMLWVAPDNKVKADICDGAYTLVASNSTVSTGNWYYAAFTVDRDGIEKLYLNGSLDCTPVSVSGVGNIDTDTCLWLGRGTHNPSLAFDGMIAEVRISDKVRTDAEIADAYAAGGVFEDDSNTIALWKLEGEGNTATDNSGNGHDGTFVGAIRPGAGVEAAIAFDGTDDCVTTPDTADLDFGTDADFTIETWFKMDVGSRQNPLVAKIVGAYPDFNGYMLWIAPDNKIKADICDGDFTLVASNSIVSTGNWYYAAFTVDRDGVEKLYLNGSLDCTPVSVSGVGNIDTDTCLWLGRGTHNPSLAFDGTIAEVRISDKVRTDAEIADAYAAGGSFENDANTIALWHLDEGESATTTDASGNGHTATLNGATWGTGPLPTPPEFAYDYDWENDATYDLTDAADSVCHTYTPGDSLWAKVKATTATYEAEDSAEVVLPQSTLFVVETLLTQSEWDALCDDNISFYFIRKDDNEEPSIAGQISFYEGSKWYEYDVRLDTSGTLDTLSSEPSPGGFFTYPHVYGTKEFESVYDSTVFVTVDEETTIYRWFERDSLVISYYYSSYPSWAFTQPYVWPLEIGTDGWSIVSIDRHPEADSLYPGWRYAIAHDLEIISRLDIDHMSSMSQVEIMQPWIIYLDSLDDNTGKQKLTIFDMNGDLVSSFQVFLYVSEKKIPVPTYVQDSSIIAFTGESDSLVLNKIREDTTYRYVFPTPEFHDSMAVLFEAYKDYLLIAQAKLVPPGNDNTTEYLYYFDLSDSIDLVWIDTIYIPIAATGMMPSGDPYLFVTTSDPCEWSIWFYSRTDGERYFQWPETPINCGCGLAFDSYENYILILTACDDPESRLMIIREVK